MERYPGQPQHDDMETEDEYGGFEPDDGYGTIESDEEYGDTEQAWVLGRDLSPSDAPANGHAPADEDEPVSGSRVTWAALAAVLSAVAVVFLGTMLVSDGFAESGWPLMLALVAVVAAALALIGWWRTGSAGRRDY